VPRAIGVMTEAPVPGRCKTKLLAAYGADWVSGLHAAMLRDTLDGLQSIDADAYVVFAEPVADEPAGAERAIAVLERHVPRPWEIVLQGAGEIGARVEHALSHLLDRAAGEGQVAVLAVSDAPSFPTAPLEAALAAASSSGPLVLGPSEDGGVYVFATSRLEPRLFPDAPWGTPALLETARVRCRALGIELRELPTWYDIDEPSDVLRLLDELRKAPELAPRTAQYLATRS
jgi:uncharacterized protein